MLVYLKLASQIVWKCLKSLCGGGGESKFGDRLWPRPRQTKGIKEEGKLGKMTFIRRKPTPREKFHCKKGNNEHIQFFDY